MANLGKNVLNATLTRDLDMQNRNSWLGMKLQNQMKSREPPKALSELLGLESKKKMYNMEDPTPKANSYVCANCSTIQGLNNTMNITINRDLLANTELGQVTTIEEIAQHPGFQDFLCEQLKMYHKLVTNSSLFNLFGPSSKTVASNRERPDPGFTVIEQDQHTLRPNNVPRKATRRPAEDQTKVLSTNVSTVSENKEDVSTSAAADKPHREIPKWVKNAAALTDDDEMDGTVESRTSYQTTRSKENVPAQMSVPRGNAIQKEQPSSNVNRIFNLPFENIRSTEGRKTSTNSVESAHVFSSGSNSNLVAENSVQSKRSTSTDSKRVTGSVTSNTLPIESQQSDDNAFKMPLPPKKRATRPRTGSSAASSAPIPSQQSTDSEGSYRSRRGRVSKPPGNYWAANTFDKSARAQSSGELGVGRKTNRQRLPRTTEKKKKDSEEPSRADLETKKSSNERKEKPTKTRPSRSRQNPESSATNKTTRHQESSEETTKTRRRQQKSDSESDVDNRYVSENISERTGVPLNLNEDEPNKAMRKDKKNPLSVIAEEIDRDGLYPHPLCSSSSDEEACLISNAVNYYGQDARRYGPSRTDLSRRTVREESIEMSSDEEAVQIAKRPEAKPKRTEAENPHKKEHGAGLNESGRHRRAQKRPSTPYRVHNVVETEEKSSDSPKVKPVQKREVVRRRCLFSDSSSEGECEPQDSIPNTKKGRNTGVGLRNGGIFDYSSDVSSVMGGLPESDEQPEARKQKRPSRKQAAKGITREPGFTSSFRLT